MLRHLENLKPGTRFRLAGMPDVTGELFDVSECSAKVRLDRGTREVEFENDDGSVRRFTAHRVSTTTWSPATVVEPITTPEDAPASAPTEETDMASKKKTSKKRKSTKPAAAKAKKPRAPKDPKEKKLSALDAAAQVLASKKEAMTAQEMIEAMAAAGLWKSPGGKTPHATLYAAIIREIGAKGKEARFVKTERGKFALAG